nr:hypothetical protein [Tanacetum cinerariifolium]
MITNQSKFKINNDQEDDDDQDNDDDQDDDDGQTDSDNDGDDFVHPKFLTHDQDERQDEEDSFDPRVQTPSHVETTNDEDNDEEIQDINIKGDKLDEEETNEEDKGDELYKDVNVNLEGRDIKRIDAQQTNSSSVSSGFVSNMLNPNPDTVPAPATIPSSSLQDLLNFSSLFGFENRLKTLEINFSEFKQTNQFAEVVSSIPGIVDLYLANKINEAIKTTVQLQLDRFRDEAQAENTYFINKLDDNIKKMIKDQVKEQVKAQVSKILPKIKKTVNEQLKAEVLTRSSNKSKTSHDVAANLSKLELKKILIDKMESNKSIHRFDEQNNIYKALRAYESDKLILDTYGDMVTLKRRRDDEDKDEEPFTGSNQGSKRRRVEKELEQPVHQRKRPPRQLASQLKGPNLITSLLMEDLRESFNELMDTPLDFTAFVMNWLKVDTLTPKLLADTTFKLMKGSCKSLVELEYFLEEVYKATTDQLEWNNPEGQKYPHDLRKPLPLIPNSRGRQVIPFAHFINNCLEESARDVYSKRRIIAITKLQILEWHNYKHLDWITVRRDDDKLYTFKEGDFNKLRIQDIKDMLLLLVQGKHVEDLQLGVESYQKKLHLINLDTYRTDLKRMEAYTTYSDPRGFIYQNKDKKNRLMHINELHKFSNGTLNDVRTALDDRLKGIRMKYLP